MKVIKSDGSNMQIEVAGKKFIVKEALGARGELGLKVSVPDGYMLIATWVVTKQEILLLSHELE